MYRLDKEDGSEFSASVIHGLGQNSISSSKLSIIGQQTVRLKCSFDRFNI
jgi:hypothetical protein